MIMRRVRFAKGSTTLQQNPAAKPLCFAASVHAFSSSRKSRFTRTYEIYVIAGAVIESHAFDDHYQANDTVIKGNGKLRLVLISRGSTYQGILAIEKEGTQVVEHDSSLPVDAIISADIWYDYRNIGKKATTLDEVPSWLPLCVEDIATNVLTLLSFTFNSYILVFEGEISFLAATMESLDGLYAAATGLGIDLQLFCSYSSELTDEIILNCIGSAIKLTRCLYTEMPESETLAESFTKFPSINPLTGHAILSFGGMLVEFLECSHERRIQAIQKYQVPDESVTLLSTLCRYGEKKNKVSEFANKTIASNPIKK